MIHVYFNHQRPEIPEISLGKPMKSTTTCVLNDFGQVMTGEGHLHIGGRFCLVNTETTDTVQTLRLNDACRCNHGCIYFNQRQGVIW